MKRGTVFEHRHWLDTKNMPLLCRVTAVRSGVVYYDLWDRDKPAGRWRWYFDECDIPRYVGQVLEEPA